MSAELMMTDETVKKSSIIANFLKNYCPFSSFYKTTPFLSSSLIIIDFLHVRHHCKMPFHCFRRFLKFSTQMPECASILFQTGFILVAMSTETKSVVVGVR